MNLGFLKSQTLRRNHLDGQYIACLMYANVTVDSIQCIMNTSAWKAEFLLKIRYTLNQRLFLVKQYWITNSITATQRAYQREFGVRNPPPQRNTILVLVNKLETLDL
ncbi:hypothetical protein ANN_02768 [Periplaneta americana]|uniref:DUF4817 domain-containing protein n=1 Tax=Periplaneta americana TaxID=6978 RepID=A0ABQ8U052_PERAM|nr:hypothetical protein ANN_02768 [Periplaneta americana]